MPPFAFDAQNQTMTQAHTRQKISMTNETAVHTMMTSRANRVQTQLETQ